MPSASYACITFFFQNSIDGKDHIKCFMVNARITSEEFFHASLQPSTVGWNTNRKKQSWGKKLEDENENDNFLCEWQTVLILTQSFAVTVCFGMKIWKYVLLLDICCSLCDNNQMIIYSPFISPFSRASLNDISPDNLRLCSFDILLLKRLRGHFYPMMKTIPPNALCFIVHVTENHLATLNETRIERSGKKNISSANDGRLWYWHTRLLLLSISIWEHFSFYLWTCVSRACVVESFSLRIILDRPRFTCYWYLLFSNSNWSLNWEYFNQLVYNCGRSLYFLSRIARLSIALVFSFAYRYSVSLGEIYSVTQTDVRQSIDLKE